jgi:quaternary ammonium compound-resistance protein SugE
MAWVLLFLAGGFEVVWALAMKRSSGFTQPWPTLLTFAAMAVSVYLLAQSLRTLPVSTAYAVWTGVGAAGGAIFGVLLFGEGASVSKVACVSLIVAGVIGLRLFSGDPVH